MIPVREAVHVADVADDRGGDDRACPRILARGATAHLAGQEFKEAVSANDGHAAITRPIMCRYETVPHLAQTEAMPPSLAIGAQSTRGARALSPPAEDHQGDHLQSPRPCLIGFRGTSHV